MLKFFHLPPSIQIKRVMTTRKNISYKVIQVDPKSNTELHRQVLNHVQALVATMALGEKGIVWTQSVSDCENLAKKAGAPFHHTKANGLGLKQWQAGSHPFIFATTAMATGCDFKRVVHSIHAGHPIN